MQRMRFDEYLAHEGMNWSTAKHIDDSPLMFQFRRRNPIEDTPRFAMGRCTHTALLEPDQMDHYAVFPGPRRAGKIWEEFEALHLAAGHTILKQAELELAVNAAEAVRKHKVAGPVFEAEDGNAESVISWTHPATGIVCKGRVDWSAISTRRLVDLKTARSSEKRRFGRQASELLYYCQIVWYGDGYNYWRIEHELEPIDWIYTLVAVEMAAPHEVGVFRLSDDQVAIARDRIEKIMARIAECERTNMWPGRAEQEEMLELPRWEYDNDLEAGDVEVEITPVIEEAA